MKTLYITLTFLFGGVVLFAQAIPQELDKPNLNPRKKKVKNLQSVSSTTQPENHFKNPDVIPPSPDVAAFGKFGEIPVSLYSGIVPIDIPFYTVKSKDISVPIGLNLHTGGVRVEEIASWTGLSTALQAGGSVSRTTIGRADDKRGGYLNQYLYTPHYLDSLAFYVPNNTYSQINPSVTNPIRHKWTVFDDQTKYYDAQPDSYNYSYCGRSGKFVIDQTNPTVGIPIPYVPIKITITYTNNQPSNSAAKDSLVEEANPFYGTMESFTITDENGVEYFYNEKETTNSKHLDPRQKTRFQYFYSAWHLSKITSPLGGQVRFSYTNYLHYHRQWSAEDRRNRDTEACPTVIGSDGYPEDINYIQRTQSQIKIGGKHISEIAWENGKVTFTPSSTNRQDVNEKPLQYISVFDADNALKKKYSLFYSYFTENSDAEYTSFNGSDVYSQPNLGRLRLDSLQETTSSTNCLPPYRFGYETGNLPHRYSNQIDHYGYYNGATTNTSLHPRCFLGNVIIGDANRHPDVNYGKIGTLNTIQYPTGGKTQMIYEGHDTYAADWGLGFGFKEIAPINYSASTFENYATQNNKVYYVNSRNQAPFTQMIVPSGGKLYEVAGFVNDDNIDLVRIYFYQGNQQIRNVPIESTEQIYLPAGTYKIYLMIADINISNFNYVNLTQNISVTLRTVPNPAFSEMPYNKSIGGLRVKTMTDFPKVGLPVVKEYIYRQENDNTKSSGQLIQTPLYAYTKNETRISYQYDSQGQTWVSGLLFDCTDLMMSASSIAPMTQTKGAYVGYEFVEVHYQQNGDNGKSTHRFTSPAIYQDYIGSDYPYVPNTDFDWKRGFETQTKQFKKKANGSYFLLKSSTNFENADSVYTNLIGVLSSCSHYGVRYGFQGQYTFGCTFPEFQNYQIVSGWITNAKTVDTVYNSTEESGAYIVNTTNYTHKGRENLQMAKMTQTSSVTGELREVTMSYPHDKKVSGNVYQQLVDAHIFTPVIEEIVKQNNTQIAKKTTNFLKWKNTRTKSINGVTINYPDFYAPQSQFWQQASTDPNELQRTFLSYDDLGNLTSYQDRDGIRTDLDWFWYDGSSRPITEKGKTHLLKSRIIGAGFSTAQTFEYDYLPGVGISQIKAPTGYFTYYSYDDLNRLVSIKDHVNFELKHFDYHYRNCGAVGGLGLSLSDTMNYVVVRTARTGGTSLNTTPEDVQTSIQYFDGLGRALQTVGYRASPDKTKDILLQTTQYDASGRANIGILPTPATGNLGKYDASALSLATAFYGDANPYNETIFEASPLNRPTKNFGAGVAWRTNNKFVEHYYRVQGNEILRFVVNSNGTFSTTGGYEGSSLNSKWTISERGINTLELSDKLGRVVAKAQQLQGFDYLITNYIYDDLDRLRAVIPPEIYKKMGTGVGQINSFTENDNIFLEGMYGYRYDSKGRLVEKHIPGAGWRYSIFDKNYREIMHSDEQDRVNNYWQFTKYDALNRPIMTGLINNIGNFTRSQLQADFDNHNGLTYEERGVDLRGYTNRSFPSSYTLQDGNLRTVTYYDDYLWQTEGNYIFQSGNAYHTIGNAKGKVTGSLMRNLETNVWDKSVKYYDYKGRNIQTFTQNHLGGIDRMDYNYRFNGEVLNLRILHMGGTPQGITEIYYYNYDHVGRKTKFLHSLNGNLKTIAKYEYDEIGRLKSKKLSPSDAIGSNQSGLWSQTGTWQGGNLPTLSDQVTINTGHTVTIPNGQTMQAGTMFNQGILQNLGTLQMGTLAGNNVGILQTVDYNYHIRGGLRGINLDASGNPSTANGKLFSMKLGYEDDGNYFDGNIRKQEWKSSIDNLTRSYTYNYDGANRILSGTYTSEKLNENYALNSVSYDGNGNITSLSRNGFKSNNTFGLVDNLTYSYNSNSNKVLKVDDLSNETASFKDVSGNDYTYYPDGSLKSDANKGISLIEYNYLKLPKKIVKGSTTILYQYDASGKKLKESIGTQVTDYVGNLIYKNNGLYQLAHDEGRILGSIYEYNIKDHLGNLRVSFKDSLGIAKVTQANSYGIWGEELNTLNYVNTSNIDNFRITSKENLAETGYTDFGARLYDNLVPRFITNDPLAEKYFSQSPQNYVMNNPIGFIDPDGMKPTPPIHHNFLINQGLQIYNSLKDNGASSFGAAFVLAQAVQESGWGKSKVAQKHNNFFGLMGGGSGITTSHGELRSFGSVSEGIAGYLSKMQKTWPTSIPLYTQQSFSSDDVNKALNTGTYSKYPAYFVQSGDQSADYGSTLIKTMVGVVNRMITSLEYELKETGNQINLLNAQIQGIEAKDSSYDSEGNLTEDSRTKINKINENINELMTIGANFEQRRKEFKDIFRSLNQTQ